MIIGPVVAFVPVNDHKSHLFAVVVCVGIAPPVHKIVVEEWNVIAPAVEALLHTDRRNAPPG